MIDVKDEAFDQEVINAGQPVVVDFWAPWCGPCRNTAPLIEELADAFPGVKFVKVNVDECPTTTFAYGVRSIPTFILFKDGTAAATYVGAAQIKALTEALNDTKRNVIAAAG